MAAIETDAEAAERAIERQHQAAIDAGRPWPPKPAATTKTPDPEAQKVIEGLQRDGHLTEPGLEKKEQAGVPNLTSPGRNGTSGNAQQ